MSKNRRHMRASRGACALAAAAALGSYATGAGAFELKHAAGGQALRWGPSQVEYVVDPSVESAVDGGSAAAASAVRGWNGVAGSLTLTTAAGKGAAKPGVDGQNSILFAPHGFAPAGNALAVTVTSYEETTGRIVDADIVINGRYRFAVLAAGVRAKIGNVAVSTDGVSTEDDREGAEAFDITHVVSHEVGHSLGLADERVDRAALMYAFTTPGDATSRVPSADDVTGIDAIYGSAPPSEGSPGPVSSPSGCRQASVAGSRSRASGAEGWMGLPVAWFAIKRRVRAKRAAALSGQRPPLRAKTVRAAISIAGAAAALLAGAAPARSAEMSMEMGSVPVGDAVARVVEVSTVNTGGVFESTVELAPTDCRAQIDCPARARAHVWGGTLGGIRQEIGGAIVPAVGQMVALSFLGVGHETRLLPGVGAPASVAVPLVEVRH